MHPHASIYTRVGISAWSVLSPAGDAAASLAAVRAQRRALVLDPAWGWCGRIAGGAGLEALAMRTLVAPASAGMDGGIQSTDPGAHGIAPPCRLKSALLPAIGIGASKGDIAALGDPYPAQAFPGWDHLSGAVARHLGIPAFIPCATAAACSTGLACLLAGADLLERESTDHALVGAAEASLTPLVVAGFATAGVLCGRTLPQAFATPTGFAPAEGAAVFLLTSTTACPWRLRAGVRLGDAGHETSFRDPRTLHTALAALWDLLPHPDLIVCHATGTAAGDRYELAGLQAGPWRDSPRLTCKPWLGHSLGASGAVELAVGLESSARRLWKLSLGFGGHLVAVALERSTEP